MKGKESRHEKRFFRRTRHLEKPKRERVEVENEKEVQARHFRLCFAWEGERRRRRRRALETNSQINMIRAISIQHTNGGVIWLCEKDSKEPAGLRKKEKTPKKGDGDCKVTFPCTHTPGGRTPEYSFSVLRAA